MKVKCSYCNDFIPKETAYSRGLSNFCNEEHFQLKQGLSKKVSAAKATTQRRRATKKPKYKLNPTEDTRNAVKGRDGYRCRFCGKPNGIEVHHVYYKSEARWEPWVHDAMNLISLCADCHNPIVHADKDRWQKVCLAVIWIREVEGDRHTLIPQMEQVLRGRNVPSTG